MAKKSSSKSKAITGRIDGWKTKVKRWVLRAFLGFVVLVALGIIGFSFINPPTTPYMFAEGRRIGSIEHQWVPMDEIAPVMARSVVAAEDANFCLHWGLDLTAIRAALADGANRGGSTISQQVVKNVYLWQERSWLRKTLEAVLTPLMEAVWSKRRVLEVYLNVAEFDTGVFGVEAAAQHYFGVSAAELEPTEAARLAAILPDPKDRSASNPTNYIRRQSARILDGAATIQADGRASCFEND